MLFGKYINSYYLRYLQVQKALGFASGKEIFIYFARFGGISVTHRIIDKYYDESVGNYSYRTQGDNNNVADSVLVPNKNVLGKVILKVPKLGYIQDLLASKGGLIFVVLIPSLIILSFDIMKIFKKVFTL